ncbi:MAG: DUF305 domain-containing protein [Gemmatimonas sp.]
MKIRKGRSLMNVVSTFVLTSAVVACAGKDANKMESTAATPASTAASASDSGAMGNMTGMPGMSGMAHNMTGDVDHDFLRMMSDHHKGLILMAHETIESKDKLTVKGSAEKIDTDQDKELDDMMTMLEKDFKDPYAPKVLPENQAMADALAKKSGTEYDRAFLQNVITHHEAAIKMIDEYLPTAKNATIKGMAENMKAKQAKEIVELRAKMR